MPLKRWVQSLKVEVRQVMVDYRQVYVHRAKFAGLCGGLLNFFKSFSAKQFNDRPATPLENESYKQAIAEVNGIHNLALSLTEETYLETVIEVGVTIRMAISNFRRNFNAHIAALNISDIDLLPINPQQDIVDDSVDCKALLEVLEKLNDPRTEGLIRDLVVLIAKYEDKAKNSQDPITFKVMDKDEIEEMTKQFDKWKLNHSDLKLQKKIGSGGYADVYNGYQKSTGKVVAIKKMHATEFTRPTFEMFRREIEVFATLHHFAVLGLVGVCTTSPFFLVTEFMSGGCLFDRLHCDKQSLSGTKLTVIALGIAQGMAYIHSKGMLHRDLKSLNILLDADDFPKVCDFGMSRMKPENDQELMSGGVGTMQWMAPEVLSSSSYGEKADVYSYGILLWEMITCDIPYRGMKDVQIASAVLNQNLRPLVPQSCPLKLKKLMTLCWDRDPDKRPEFRDIIKAFESGEVAFSGTNRSVVQAYIEQFTPDSNSQTSDEQVIANQDEDFVDSVMNKLGGEVQDQIQAIKLICSVMKDESRLDTMAESGICKKLVSIMACCNSASLALEIIDVIYEMSMVPPLLSQLVENGYAKHLLELFMRFGTTGMKKMIKEIKIALENETQVEISPEIMTKLSSFLLAGDLSIRRTGIDVFVTVVKNKMYVSESCLPGILPNVLQNLIADTLPELISSALELITLLVGIPSSFQCLVKLDGAVSLIPLLKHASADIRKSAFVNLEKLLTGGDPSTKVISVFVSVFKELITTESTSQALAIMHGFTRFPATFSEIRNSEDILDAFRACLSSDDESVVISSLKLCFIFLTNELSASYVSALAPDFIDLLSSDQTVSLLAGSALVAAFHHMENRQEILNKKLTRFIQKNLKRNSVCKSVALRLTGVLTSDKQSAQFLDESGIIESVVDMLVGGSESDSSSDSSESYHSDYSEQSEDLGFVSDADVRKLLFMVVAAHSATCVFSPCLIRCIDVCFDALDDEDYSVYAIAFLSNISAITSGAVACVKQIEKISELLESEDDALIGDGLKTIYRLAKNRDSRKLLNVKNMKKVVACFPSLLDGCYCQAVLLILESLVLNASLGELLKSSELMEVLRQQVEQAELKALKNRVLSLITVSVK